MGFEGRLVCQTALHFVWPGSVINEIFDLRKEQDYVLLDMSLYKI
jgi:hypothetical protein